MSYLSLYNAIEGALRSLGYTPTPSDHLHSTLLAEGLPIASIEPLELLSTEGEREHRHSWRVHVKLLNNSEQDALQALRVAEKLSADGCSLVEQLAQSSSVLEVVVERCVLLALPQTVAGDTALSLMARVTTLSCSPQE